MKCSQTLCTSEMFANNHSKSIAITPFLVLMQNPTSSHMSQQEVKVYFSSQSFFFSDSNCISLESINLFSLFLGSYAVTECVWFFFLENHWFSNVFFRENQTMRTEFWRFWWRISFKSWELRKCLVLKFGGESNLGKYFQVENKKRWRNRENCKNERVQLVNLEDWCFRWISVMMSTLDLRAIFAFFYEL